MMCLSNSVQFKYWTNTNETSNVLSHNFNQYGILYLGTYTVCIKSLFKKHKLYDYLHCIQVAQISHDTLH